MAADAKVVLDDDAVFRHPGARRVRSAWSSDSRFMQRCRELGVIGVDNRTSGPPPKRPSVALLGNGAGLTMATYDQIALVRRGRRRRDRAARRAGARRRSHRRGHPHAVPARGGRGLHQCLLPAAVHHALAQALLQWRSIRPARLRVSAWSCGCAACKQETSQKMLEEAGCFYTPSLSEATARVLAVVDAMSRKAGMAR